VSLHFAALRRLAWTVVLVFGVVTAAWVMTALLPGDPVQAAMGPQASPADVERARLLLGTDQPASCRYLRYMSRLLHAADAPDAIDGPFGWCASPAGAPADGHRSCSKLGGVHVDLGYSFTYRKPVTELVAKKLPATLELAVAATFVQLLVGIGLGVLAATRRGGRTDDAVVGASVALSAAPTFVVGLVLQYILAYRLSALPFDGYGAGSGGRLAAVVLPALTLGLYGSALFVRLVRAELSDALGQPYVLAARARGASRARAGLVHALRNASAPIVHLGVLELGALAGGAIVTERIFRWPGLGEMAVLAVQNRDAQAITGVTIVASTAIVLATAVSDVLAMALDPRLRSAER
jgi:peptide/nickel transport system permease protein